MRIKEFLKRYSAFALVSVVLSDLLAYYGSTVLNGDRARHSVMLSLDYKIPFVPAFIIVYVLAFVQWVFCFAFIAAEDKKKGYYFCVAATLANLICGIIFLAYPTVMASRPPAPEGNVLIGWLVRFIYTADNPSYNLIPSIHCFESWMCIRIAFDSKKLPASFKAVNLVFSVLVFAAVLFVKQHGVIDIPAGIIVAEIGCFITRKFKLDEKFMGFEYKLLS